MVPLHPLPTYIGCLITFMCLGWAGRSIIVHEWYLTILMCCGWAHGTFIMPLPLNVLIQMLEVSQNTTSLLGNNGCHCAVVKALTHHRMDPTPPPNIRKAFDYFHILWMGTWNLYHATTTTCVDPDVGSCMKSCITPGLQRIPSCSGWGSHTTQHGRFPKSPSNIWKVLEYLYAVDGYMDPLSWNYHHMY